MHPPAPVLYGIRLADGKIGYAREHDLVAASDGQVREYRRAAHRWAAIRGSHGPQR